MDQDTLTIIEQEAIEDAKQWMPIQDWNDSEYCKEKMKRQSDYALGIIAGAKRGYELAMEKMGNHPNSIQYMKLVEKNKELQKEINELDEEIRNRTPYNF